MTKYTKYEHHPNILKIKNQDTGHWTIYTRTGMQTRANTSAHIRICARAHTPARTNTRTSTHGCTCKRTHALAHTHARARARTRTGTGTGTHKYNVRDKSSTRQNIKVFIVMGIVIFFEICVPNNKTPSTINTMIYSPCGPRRSRRVPSQ